MANTTIAKGTVHSLPTDIRNALVKHSAARTAWETLTPLARNEWICWVTFVKQDNTRKEHIQRLVCDLKNGKRRPCCWIGCIHRTDKKISPSVQGILSKQKKS
ncbi:MAG: YdeI/OmpD-associated family protein [Patescibacteria group bacterium]